MNPALLWGIGVVTLAGILQGSFAAPMKRMSGWQWENSWLLFALSGLIVFPWIINFATVPAKEASMVELAVLVELKSTLLVAVGANLLPAVAVDQLGPVDQLLPDVWFHTIKVLIRSG